MGENKKAGQSEIEHPTILTASNISNDNPRLCLVDYQGIKDSILAFRPVKDE